MKEHEKEHCEFFENEIKKRNIQPTKFLPLWDLLGVGLGFGSTLLGKKAAMLCTASVEEVIDKHYLDQINQLGNDEKNLKKKIYSTNKVFTFMGFIRSGVGFRIYPARKKSGNVMHSIC